MAKIVWPGSGNDDKKPGTGGGTGGGSSGGNTGGGTGGGTGGSTGGGTGGNTGGSTGGNTGGGTSSGIDDYFTSAIGGGGGGNIKDKIFGNQKDEPSSKETAQTAISDLRKEYEQMLQDKYNYSAQKLRDERDAALRENWILQQQAEANLPERLAAAGLSGGATETSLADLRAQYQGGRNDIQGDYMDNLGALGQEHLAESARNAQSYNEKWLEYLLDVARAEATAKYNK